MNMKEYIEETRENVKEYIEEEWKYLQDKTTNEIYDELFMADTVTGNGSGSYTFNTYDAEENTKDLIWDEEFRDALQFEYGESLSELLERGAEAVDVTARCLALSYINIDDIMEEVREEKEEDEE